MKTEDIDLKKFAADLRLIADEVEANRMACVGIVTCDLQGHGGPACVVRPDLAGDVYELMDEMADALREVLKLTLDDMR